MWLQKVPDTVGVTVWRLGCSPQLWAESRLWGRELERARLWVRAPGKWPSIRAELPSQGGNWRAPQQTRPGCTGYPWEEGEKFQLSVKLSWEWQGGLGLLRFTHKVMYDSCNPMDYSLPGSSVHGISQAEYWSGLAFPSAGDLPNPGVEPMSPAFAGGFFTKWGSREVCIHVFACIYIYMHVCTW